ncbi:MAG: MATE family efflux transporter [Candidatus Woesearchaeota archaeon]
MKVSDLTTNPRKALLILSWPIVVSMLIQVMYNIVDTAFVGRLGSDAIAALTFAFPLFILMVAITSGLGAGYNALISRFVGSKKVKSAQNAALHALLISIVASIIFAFLGLIFLRPLFMFFGAKGNVLELGIAFMSIIFAFSPLMFVSYAITSFFTAVGDTKTSMKIQVTSLVVNIILDPILIFGLHLGVRGAALATAAAYLVSLGLGIYFSYCKSCKEKNLVRLRVASWSFSPSILKSIFIVGFPATLMNFILSVYVVIINMFMSHFGTDYVAAFGLGSRLESLAVLPFVGVSFSMLTLVAMFIGAKKHKELKNFVWYGIRISVILSSAIGVVFFFLSGFFFRIFTSDPVLISLSTAYMRIDVLTFPLMAIGFTVARIIQAMGDGFAGLVVTLTRVLFVFVPVSYFFVFVLGYGFLSVAFSMVIGGIVSNIVGLIWLRKKMKGFDH